MDLSRLHAAVRQAGQVAGRSVIVVNLLPINNGRAVRTLLSTARALSPTQLAETLAEESQGRLRVLPRSVIPVRQNGAYHLTSAVIEKAAVVKSMADTASMVRIGDGKFRDHAGYIWTVQGSGEDRHIVFNDEEDLAKILEARRKRIVTNTPSLVRDAAMADFAMAVDTYNKVTTGFIFPVRGGKVRVMNPELSLPFDLPRENVLVTVDQSKVKTPFRLNLAAALNADNTLDLDAVFAYLKRAYAMSPEYVEQYRQAVMQQGL